MQAPRFMVFPVWLGFMAVAPAQYFYPKKDVAFAQVVAGGGFESVINLTNRGPSSYVGTLTLFRLDNAPWSPELSGARKSSREFVRLQEGEFQTEILPGETVTFRLTGSELESGAALLLSNDLLLDNLIEANLTYRVLEEGRVIDSVGIAASREFYRTVLPFEKFPEVGLALVNGAAKGGVTAEVELTLFSAEGEELRTEPLTLGPHAHRARFLHEFFPGQALEGGRVEIVSDAPIFGTALTLTGGEFSSLSLEPAPLHYSVRLETEDGAATGDLALWAQGSFLRGYLAITALDDEAFADPEFSLVQGELEGGRLRLAFRVLRDPFLTEEATLSLGHDEFSFGAPAVSGKWIELFPDETVLKGRYVLTRRDGG